MEETVATQEPVQVKKKGRPPSAYRRCEICHIHRHKCRHGKEEQEQQAAGGGRKEDESEHAAASAEGKEEELGSQGTILNICSSLLGKQ